MEHSPKLIEFSKRSCQKIVNSKYRKQKARRGDYQRQEIECSVGLKSRGEEWLEVIGYEGRYRVSNLGRVFKLWNRGGGIMLGTQDVSRYVRYHLTDANGNGKIRFGHRIVAEAFLPKRIGANHVNHKDFNPFNNRVENLEWATPSENVNYSASAGRMHGPTLCRGEDNANSKLTNSQVLIIKRKLMLGERIRQVAKQFNVTDGAIAHIKHNRQWKLVNP